MWFYLEQVKQCKKIDPSFTAFQGQERAALNHGKTNPGKIVALWWCCVKLCRGLKVHRPIAGMTVTVMWSEMESALAASTNQVFLLRSLRNSLI